MKNELTPKQQRFVEEYLIDMNGTQAAIRAGYSARTANEQAARLLAKDSISQAVAAARAERSSRVAVSADYVLSNLVEIVERSMQRAPVLTTRGKQACDEDGNALWRFDAKAANKALELLGKNLGMFTDKIEADVSANVKVVLFGGD